MQQHFTDGIKMRAEVSMVLAQFTRLKDGQTDEKNRRITHRKTATA